MHNLVRSNTHCPNPPKIPFANPQIYDETDAYVICDSPLNWGLRLDSEHLILQKKEFLWP